MNIYINTHRFFSIEKIHYDEAPRQLGKLTFKKFLRRKKPHKAKFLTVGQVHSKSHSVLESFWLGKMSVQFHEVNKHYPGNYSVSPLLLFLK